MSTGPAGEHRPYRDVGFQTPGEETSLASEGHGTWGLSRGGVWSGRPEGAGGNRHHRFQAPLLGLGSGRPGSDEYTTGKTLNSSDPPISHSEGGTGTPRKQAMEGVERARRLGSV